MHHFILSALEFSGALTNYSPYCPSNSESCEEALEFGDTMTMFKFCPECNNILYPKEDKKRRVLLYACRNCDHWELADKYCVYRHEIDAPPYELSLTLHEALADPTLPRTKSVRCPKCNHNEAIYYKATVRGEDGLVLCYICCNQNCGHTWKD